MVVPPLVPHAGADPGDPARVQGRLLPRRLQQHAPPDVDPRARSRHPPLHSQSGPRDVDPPDAQLEGVQPNSCVEVSPGCSGSHAPRLLSRRNFHSGRRSWHRRDSAAARGLAPISLRPPDRKSFQEIRRVERSTGRWRSGSPAHIVKSPSVQEFGTLFADAQVARVAFSDAISSVSPLVTAI